MQNYITEYLKEIRKVFNFFISAFSLFVLRMIVKGLCEYFQKTGCTEEINILDLKIHSVYFSLIYGILFGSFIFILFLKIRLLNISIIQMEREKNNDSSKYIHSIRFFPWIASPFHWSKVGYWFFWIIISLGFLKLGSTAFAHIIRKPNIEEISLFNLIGYINLIIFILGFIFVRFVYKYITDINNKINSIEQAKTKNS